MKNIKCAGAVVLTPVGDAVPDCRGEFALDIVCEMMHLLPTDCPLFGLDSAALTAVIEGSDSSVAI